jgi:hypothetical protein
MASMGDAAREMSFETRVAVALAVHDAIDAQLHRVEPMHADRLGRRSEAEGDEPVDATPGVIPPPPVVPALALAEIVATLRSASALAAFVLDRPPERIARVAARTVARRHTTRESGSPQLRSGTAPGGSSVEPARERPDSPTAARHVVSDATLAESIDDVAGDVARQGGGAADSPEELPITALFPSTARLDDEVAPSLGLAGRVDEVEIECALPFLLLNPLAELGLSP